MTIALSIAVALAPLVVAVLTPFRTWQAAGPAVALRSGERTPSRQHVAASANDVEAAVRARLYGQVGSGRHR